MTNTVDFLLLGGGLASATAAETLRTEGAEGSIVILSAEPSLPYHRPPLSKQYLATGGEAGRQLVHPASWYAEQHIDVRLDTAAASVDPANHVVLTQAGERIPYAKLLIATGGRPNAMDVPGVTLASIHRSRTFADVDGIRADAQAGRRAVIVGGSFLSLEVATTLAARGVSATLLVRGPAVMRKLYAPPLSTFFTALAHGRGIVIELNETIARFEGAGRVSEVVTESGRRFPCDFVVLALGITPNCEFLAQTGVKLDNGVVADERLKSSDPDIFAAGDVANYFDPVFRRRRRIEHWDNAVKQGRLAARNMLGQNLPSEEISYFFADMFDLSFSMLGAPEDGTTLVPRGALDEHSYRLLYLANDVPRAVFSLGRPADETRAVEGLIRHRVNLSAVAEKLGDDDLALDRIPTQTVLILQGGGALGAFECGVVKALEEAHIHPDVVAGVSIGAFNGAIIASHPGNAASMLEAFWNELAVTTPELFNLGFTRAASAAQILTLGVPKFFRPRWLGMPLMAGLPLNWTSLYDTSPVRDLIQRYVDFGRLKSSPVRLIVSAVNVETAELEMFDSYVDDLTPDHILASGSLPPGFPATTINGKTYWDGGIISNSPLDLVLERCGATSKQVYVVDLFAGRKPLPTNLLEVMARRDEILFAERVRNDLKARELVEEFRHLVEEVMHFLDDDTIRRVKQRPRYIQLMGLAAPNTITRIVREGEMGEPSSRDYDFSRPSVERNMREGYRLAKEAIETAK